MGSSSHPVEVVGRIRAHPDGKDEHSALTVLPSGKSVRVRHDQGYRDFVLDGVSVADAENLRGFYTKYVEARVDDVRSGGRCTVLMYGPTGSGKSHTMFGSTREPGVAYLALHHIMMGRLPPKGPLAPLDHNAGGTNGVNVSANVVEIYNEEVYDLLSINSMASPGPKCMKTLPGRARLEVRGRKVRNATSISGADPGKLVHEISKVEKRRVVKSTACNERSSRSHCMVVLDVSGVGGKLILVDMAGSENSEQAGIGQEAKLQTGKINQGNGALKRVVESIANGDTHIPYRDSKLTMLLQDSFEEDGAKMLMVLCASPDLKDAHKTICTLEYGAKAKCIVRLPKSPPKEAATFADGIEAVLQARLRFKDECLERLRMEYEQKKRDSEAKAQELARQEQELAVLRSLSAKLELEGVEKMKEMQKHMEIALEEKSKELKKAVEFEMQMDVQKLSDPEGRPRLAELEEMIENQKQEIAVWRLRAEKAEVQLLELQNSGFSEAPGGWVESAEVVDMDISNSLCISRDFSKVHQTELRTEKDDRSPEGKSEVIWNEIGLYRPGWLPIIPEEADESNDPPVTKLGDSCEVRTDISQDGVCTNSEAEYSAQGLRPSNLAKTAAPSDGSSESVRLPTVSSSDIGRPSVPTTPTSSPISTTSGHKRGLGEADMKSPVADRRARIENIFLLCGNHREVAAKYSGPKTPDGQSDVESPVPRSPSPYGNETPSRSVKSSPEGSPWLKGSAHKRKIGRDSPAVRPLFGDGHDARVAEVEAADGSAEPRKKTDVYVKWEASKNGSGKAICVINIGSSSSLSELRKEIQAELPSDFYFLILGDLGGAPVEKETESMLLVSSLPFCADDPSNRLACLRAAPQKIASPKIPFRALDCNQVLLMGPVTPKVLFSQENLGA